MAHPGDFWLNYVLGYLLVDRKDYAEAQTYSSIAVSLRPDSAIARNNLAVALSRQGKRDEAIACYQKAIELDPNYARAYSNLGNAYRHQKKMDQAIACLQKAIELDPKYAHFYLNLGDVYAVQKKMDQAIACFQKAIEIDPKLCACLFEPRRCVPPSEEDGSSDHLPPEGH